ncbi:chromate transporter [Bordetella genomosp. 12]|uniref:Chromate transporter n=1 Tax=Bordetella genomosp. 12 TaxID=463035 RepID=A0A261VKZ6_9BORD|nr:chromate transporter [Bordetella genomosp. 12]OZI74755.1 chromate transporter [Bordetella genomosp. 12]
MAHDDTAAPAPTAWRLFLIFARIGLTSFGGGLSGWLYREFVQDRGWMSEEAFFNGLALSQALPGVNVKNMAIWIGYRLAGARGALAGFLGIILPPAVFIVCLSMVIAELTRFPLTHVALAGAAAAAIGLSANMAIAAAVRLPRRVMPWIFMVTTFVAVGLLNWPLVWVVLAEGAASIALEYRRLGGR